MSNPYNQLNVFLHYWLVMLIVFWTLVSCIGGDNKNPPNPKPPTGGPSFVINSPKDGSSISGTIFFAAQPSNSSEVKSVNFKAGSTDLGTDTTANDGFKVFLNAKDFPQGTLELTALLTGKNGKTTTKKINVTNVPAPPSNAKTTAKGAVLGTTEANGALSTLTIPAGATEGANVTFKAKTKADVKAATGVDYDSLGVTFLGAQEITASKPLDSALAITSGGFGPMVQPNQAVVNYMIAPDGDGDGVGELVVVNTASVTPNGDIISDPIQGLQIGSAEVTILGNTSTLTTLQNGLSGPTGTRIRVETQGLNPTSIYGNLAIWSSKVNNQVFVIPGAVLLNPEDKLKQTFTTFIPPLEPGLAELTITNNSNKSETITVRIEPSQPLSKDYKEVIRELLTQVENSILTLSPTSPEDEAKISEIAAKFAEAKTQFNLLVTSELPPEVTDEIEVELVNMATMIENSGVFTLLQSSTALNPLYDRVDDLVMDLLALMGAIATIAAGIVALVASTPFAAAFALALVGGVALLGIAFLLCKILGGGYCFDEPPCIVPGTPGVPSLEDALTPPGEPGLQQTNPNSGMTGMGSVVPPGGDGCGTTMGDNPANSSSLQSQNTGLETLYGDLAGRFIVKVFYGSGNTVPFTGVSDSGGYFYIPTIPAGQPFEAIAFDTLTNETRSFEGTGPEIGSSTYMLFDFFEEGTGGNGTVIDYNTNTQGTYGGTDIYLFEGEVNDLIKLSVFSEDGNTSMDFQLSDANGRSLINGVTTGGSLLETAIVELELNGLYTFTINGSQNSGDYTLGLAKIDPPVALDMSTPLLGNLETLGEQQYYSFSGNLDEILNIDLSHDPASSLNAELNVLQLINGLEFYQGASIVIRLRTDDNNRSKSGSRTLTADGEYIIEMGLNQDNIFANDLTKHLGSYQVDISLDQP